MAKNDKFYLETDRQSLIKVTKSLSTRWTPNIGKVKND